MIDLVKINEPSFKKCVGFDGTNCSIMAKLHALDIDMESAKHCMICLNSLLQRLCLEKIEWLEEALVSRVYIIVKYPLLQGIDGVKDLRKLLDGTSSPLTLSQQSDLRKNIPTQLSSKSICSVQMVCSFT